MIYQYNILLLIFIFTACSNLGIRAKKTEFSSGVDFTRIDNAVRPQDDFYRFVNGNWLNQFELPPDKSRYSTFTKLRDKAREDIKKIIEEASTKGTVFGSDNQKIGDLYHSYMDTKRLEDLGGASLNDEMNKIEKIKNISDLAEYFAYSDIVSSAPFGIYVYINKKKPNEYITYCSQSGLGLPNRGYYMDNDENSKKIRSEYIIHIAKMLALYGFDNSIERANKIMDIEKQLAKYHWKKEKNRDPVATYNLYSFNDFKSLIPSFNWDRWEKANLLNKIDKIIVSQPDYIGNIDNIIKNISIEDWKKYFSWKLLNRFARFLSSDFEKQNFYFYRTILSGVEEMEPRWKRGVNLVDRSMGEIVGKVYVENHFNHQAKKRMIDLVENLRTAYKVGIDELDWMSDSTKIQAQEKLRKFRSKIGFPNKWKKYDKLSVYPDKLVKNVMNTILDQTRKNREKLGKPIDREEWGMTPQTVNAYYSPLLNEIVFPAAILQPPFFTLDADDAVNYGAIGAVIGHEMGHGFDDSGSQYDGEGQLRNWWMESDRNKFEMRTKKLIEQYDKYTVVDGTNVNGEFTQGENIGDLTGVVIAYKAYQLSKQGKEAPVIDGLTGDERFFYGWATIWAVKSTNEAILRQIKTDPHSPGEFRANGPLVNMPEFIKLFNVKEGDGMFVTPENRVKIW